MQVIELESTNSNKKIKNKHKFIEFIMCNEITGQH